MKKNKKIESNGWIYVGEERVKGEVKDHWVNPAGEPVARVFASIERRKDMSDELREKIEKAVEEDRRGWFGDEDVN